MAEDRLWAPWRLAYIEAEKPQGGCIFCEKPADGDDEAAHIVHRGERCFVMLNAFPYNNGHVMVSPYRHVPSIESLDDEEGAELFALTRRSLGVLREVYGPDGFNLGVNEGKAAGAGFDAHVHQHLVPRWNGDTNFMPVVADTRTLPQSLEESFRRVHEAFAAASAPA